MNKSANSRILNDVTLTGKSQQTQKQEKFSSKDHTVQKTVDGASSNAARASPKSQSFSLQSALASIFFGFKSRWKTLAAEKRKIVKSHGACRTKAMIAKQTGNLTSMYVLQSSKKLVKKKLMMPRGEIIICLNDMMKIRFHQLKYNIDIFEFSSTWRQHYMFDFDDIRVAQHPQELYFS